MDSELDQLGERIAEQAAQISEMHERLAEVERVIARVMDPARAAWYAEQGLHTISPTQHAIEMFEQALELR